MGYFGGLVSNEFRYGPDGEVLVRGDWPERHWFLVPAERRASFIRARKILYGATILTIIGLFWSPLPTWLVFVGGLPLLMLFHWIVWRLQCRRLEPATIEPVETKPEVARRIAEATGKPTLTAFLIVSGLFCLGGVVAILMGDILVGSAGLAFFGAAVVLFWKDLQRLSR